jgi:hypothetical protein
MKFKKVRRKDYETKSDFYNAFLAENWWRILILFTLAVAVIELITYFTSHEAFVVILLGYVIFTIMFSIESISQKKKGYGSFMADPTTILGFCSVVIILSFIASFFV